MSGYEMYRPVTSDAQNIFNEFSQLSDMVWKFPRFLENETRIEQDKLDGYFPISDRSVVMLRTIRASSERQKLFVEFPRYLHQTGVLLTVALYEARLVQSVNRILCPEKPVDGLNGCQEYLQKSGYSLDDLRFARQVEIALVVRHCIIHLSGYIDHLRRGDWLIKQIMNKQYLEAWQIDRGIEGNGPILSIEQDDHGNRLVICHTYAFSIGSRLRDNLCELIDRLS